MAVLTEDFKSTQLDTAPDQLQGRHRPRAPEPPWTQSKTVSSYLHELQICPIPASSSSHKNARLRYCFPWTSCLCYRYNIQCMRSITEFALSHAGCCQVSVGTLDDKNIFTPTSVVSIFLYPPEFKHYLTSTSESCFR